MFSLVFKCETVASKEKMRVNKREASALGVMQGGPGGREVA